MKQEEIQRYIERLASELSKLIEPPTLIHRLIFLLKDPDATADDIVRELSKDPVLVAQTLKIANTILVHSQEVKSIKQAVVILGTKQILHLAIGAWTAQVQKIESKFFGMGKGELAKFSIFGAVASVEFANIAGLSFIAETIFTASTMRTIGRAVMDAVVGQRSAGIMEKIIKKIAQEKKTFTQSLKDILGFDYNELGAELIRKWNLPEEFYFTTKYYTRPSLYRGDDATLRKVIACVHLGDIVARMIGETTPRDSFLEIYDRSAAQELDIEDDTRVLQTVADKVLSQREEILKSFRLEDEG